MQFFQCQRCAQPIFFENTSCENCGAALGYLPDDHVLTALEREGKGWKTPDQPKRLLRYCQNFGQGVCNWLLPLDAPKPLCPACGLNRTIPNLVQPANLAAWRALESAKHRLVYSLLRLELPVQSKTEDPATGLAFDFLSRSGATPDDAPVQTGHDNGLITIDLAEADSAHREKARLRMGEAYRTLIGHFRHEVGHYYWERLVATEAAMLEEFRKLFGDERADYWTALKNHYQSGPPDDWGQRFLSAYATAHPWEDWAESWAHYLHLLDLLETAEGFGITINPKARAKASLTMTANFDPYRQADFDVILEASIPLTLAVNSLNRSMGQPDLYPFVLPAPAVEKLRFIHRLVRAAASRTRNASSTQTRQSCS